MTRITLVLILVRKINRGQLKRAELCVFFIQTLSETDINTIDINFLIPKIKSHCLCEQANSG